MTAALICILIWISEPERDSTFRILVSICHLAKFIKIWNLDLITKQIWIYFCDSTEFFWRKAMQFQCKTKLWRYYSKALDFTKFAVWMTGLLIIPTLRKYRVSKKETSLVTLTSNTFGFPKFLFMIDTLYFVEVVVLLP